MPVAGSDFHLDGKFYSIKELFMLEMLLAGRMSPPAPTGTWEQLSLPPPAVGKRYGSIMHAIDGKLYVHGGFDTNGSPLGSLFVYDPSISSWSQLATGPVLASHASWVWNGRLYMCTTNAVPTDKFLWYYTPATNTWIQENKTGEYTYPGRSAAILGDKVYFYSRGGYASYNPLPRSYNHITGATADFASGRRPVGQSLLGHNSSLFLYTGYDYDISGNITSKLYRYDTVTNTWTALAPNPLPVRWYQAATLAGDNIYIHGGRPSTSGLAGRDDFWTYNIPSATWKQLNKAPTGRFSHVLATLDGHIYLYGGKKEIEVLGDFWRFTP